jgi:ribonuclease R
VGASRQRDAVLELLAEAGRALDLEEIATQLGVAGRKRPRLERLLETLADDGVLRRARGDRYEPARLRERTRERIRPPEELEGTITVHARGFGFIAAPGLREDVWVPGESLGTALHGDTVRFRVVGRSKRGLEGAVSAVLRRRLTRIAGVLQQRGPRLWLYPDDSRIPGPVALEEPVKGRGGDAVVAEITQYPEVPGELPTARVLSTLGVPGDSNVEVAKVLLREGVDEEHPPAAVAEAEAFGREVDESALAGREDLTGLPLPTIDPEDARDHDDAVWVERDAQGRYRAWIAIADVSHYVRPGSALDASALERGNSIYLPDRAIPMLPPALSSNLCSLLPHVLRLCMCAVVDLEANGTITGVRLIEGYMRSAAKLTYPGVARALGLSEHAQPSPEADALRDGLQVAWELAQVLRRKRMRRGALDLDLPEPRVLLDEETGAPVSVQRRAHDPGVKKAYQLIEELMLLANEVIATFLAKRTVPTVYRVHAPPDRSRLERFAALCRELDVDFDADRVLTPKRLSQLLRTLADHPRRSVLQLLLLRSLQQARYDPTNIGHFGLASRAYLHFTSPIRRYPDLVVHRGLREVLRGAEADESEEALERLADAASHANTRERGALEIEREVVDLYRCLYMRGHVGERFEGSVTSIANGALFLALDDPFVDVRVPVESLGRERYALAPSGLRLIGERSGHAIALGDRMRVEIEGADVPRRTVYAHPVSDGQHPARGRAPRKPKKVRVQTRGRGKTKDKRSSRRD